MLRRADAAVVEGATAPWTGPDPIGCLSVDDAGVVLSAEESLADLLGCRAQDLVHKPLAVYLSASGRRELYATLRRLRGSPQVTTIDVSMLSREPVVVRAGLRFVPASGSRPITVEVVSAQRLLDPGRLPQHLASVRARQRELTHRLDDVMRPRRTMSSELDVAVEPAPLPVGAAAVTPVLTEWRLMPTGELFVALIASLPGTPSSLEVARTLREAMHALVVAGTPPSDLLGRLERTCGLRAVGPLAVVVAAYGSPDGSKAQVVSAGAPMPLVRRNNGHVSPLLALSAPLGSVRRPEPEPRSVKLREGDALVLAASLAASSDLDARLSALPVPAVGAASAVRQLIGTSAPRDTLAVACIVRGRGPAGAGTAAGNDLRLELTRDQASSIGRFRDELTRWLERRAVRRDTIERTVLVVSELATNALKAARDRVVLHASVDGGAVLLEISDDGASWQPESGMAHLDAGGLGLRLASSLTEALHIASSPAGTVIRARVGARSGR